MEKLKTIKDTDFGFNNPQPRVYKELSEYQRFKINKDGKEDISEFKTIYMFLFRTNEDFIKPVDPENPEARWVARDKIADLLTHPKDKDFFLKVSKEI